MSTPITADIEQNGKEKDVEKTFYNQIKEGNTDGSKEAEYQEDNYEVNIPKSQNAFKVKTVASSDENTRYHTIAHRMPKATTHTSDGSKTMHARALRTLASEVSMSGFKNILKQDLMESRVDNYAYNNPFDKPTDKPSDNECGNESILKRSLPAPPLSRSPSDLASGSSLDLKPDLKSIFNDCDAQLYCEISDTLRANKNDTDNFQADNNVDNNLTLYAFTPCTFDAQVL
ncbi:uncharacterized protein LOC117116009 [Anneissia japonica]|uniref:uncharacterized protein LOC117116009 n=1 Tax=Anneissia japonica TaxID=1529436 RepID=UPI0014254DFE|nr:uncharacterized protein LOC117116009 [Anneissia japonica]